MDSSTNILRTSSSDSLRIGTRASTQSVVSRPAETQISLLNLFHGMFDIEQVKGILQSMPSPLPDIKPGWGTPRLADTPVNVEFVGWLKSRNIISSWSRGTGLFGDGIRINLFRK